MDITIDFENISKIKNGEYICIGMGFMLDIKKQGSKWIGSISHDLWPKTDRAGGKTLKECLYNCNIVASCMAGKILAGG